MTANLSQFWKEAPENYVYPFFSRQTPIPVLVVKMMEWPGEEKACHSFLSWHIWCGSNPPTYSVLQVMSQLGSGGAFSAGSWVCKSQISYGAQTWAGKRIAPVFVMQLEGCDLNREPSTAFTPGTWVRCKLRVAIEGQSQQKPFILAHFLCDV